MNIIFGNEISVDEFNFLRRSVGWNEIERSLAIKTINNALFIVTAIIDEKIVGLTRVSGDGGYTIFITDVIVLPEYQNRGIGKKLLSKAMDYIKDDLLEKNQSVFINLMAAKGKEGFYKNFGFEERPNEKVGSGMTQWLSKD
jgi:ribosomal protein S18 acetylase RimI-like enzyme